MIYGMIMWWGRPLEEIPPGFALCDGSGGTPDLRDRFIPGAGDTYLPGDTGGGNSHNHDFTGDGHRHALPVASDVQAGAVNYRLYLPDTDYEPAVGTTDDADSRPQFLALYPIMYVGL